MADASVQCLCCSLEVAKGDKVMRDGSDIWHLDCFLCSDCHVKLEDSFFLSNQKLYCKEHHPFPRCSCCKDVVSGKEIIKIAEKRWHKKCFICSDCSVPLSSQPFYLFQDKIVCKAHVSSISQQCQKCSTAVLGKFVAVGRSLYHTTCLVCDWCQQPITGSLHRIGAKFSCDNCVEKEELSEDGDDEEEDEVPEGVGAAALVPRLMQLGSVAGSSTDSQPEAEKPPVSADGTQPSLEAAGPARTDAGATVADNTTVGARPAAECAPEAVDSLSALRPSVAARPRHKFSLTPSDIALPSKAGYDSDSSSENERKSSKLPRSRVQTDVAECTSNIFAARYQSVVRVQTVARGWLARRLFKNLRKLRNHRTNVAQEILETERKYVTMLGVCVELYIQPIRSKTVDTKLSDEEFNTIFSNVQLILGVNSALLKDLEERIGSWNVMTTVIGDVFQKMAPFMKSYAQYFQNYEKASLALGKALKTNSSMARFCNACKQDPKSASLDLASLLIMPVQRIPRYNLLIQDLLKHTWIDHPDYDGLQSSLVQIQELAQELNASMKVSDGLDKIIEIQASLVMDQKSDPIPVLVLPTRRYIRSGAAYEELWRDEFYPLTSRRRPIVPMQPVRPKMMPRTTSFKVLQPSNNTVLRRPGPIHLFLFNDILLVTKDASKTRTPTYCFRFCVSLVSCSASHITIGEKSYLTLRYNTDQNVAILLPSEAEAKLWHSEISQATDTLVQQTFELCSHEANPEAALDRAGLPVLASLLLSEDAAVCLKAATTIRVLSSLGGRFHVAMAEANLVPTLVSQLCEPELKAEVGITLSHLATSSETAVSSATKSCLVAQAKLAEVIGLLQNGSDEAKVAAANICYALAQPVEAKDDQPPGRLLTFRMAAGVPPPPQQGQYQEEVLGAGALPLLLAELTSEHPPLLAASLAAVAFLTVRKKSAINSESGLARIVALLRSVDAAVARSAAQCLANVSSHLRAAELASSVAVLTSLLGNKDEPTCTNACRSLSILVSASEYNREQFIQADGVKKVVALLRTEDALLRIALLELLGAMADDQSVVTAVRELGVLSTVAQLLLQDHEAVQQHAAILVGKFAADDSNRLNFRVCGVFEGLNRLLCAANRALNEYGLQSVRLMCLDSDDHREACRLAQGVGSVVRLLSPEMDFEVREQAMMTALELCRNRSVVVDISKEAAFLPLFIEMLDTQNDSITCRACEALTLLAEQDAVKDAFGEFDGFRLLLACLTSENETLLLHALACVAILSRNDKNKEYIGDSGALPLLWGFCERGRPAELQTVAVQALKYLSFHDKNKGLLAQKACLTPIVQLIDVAGDDAMVVMNALSVLKELSTKDKLQLRLHECGALLAAGECLAHSHPGVKLLAASICVDFTLLDTKRAKLVKDVVGLEVLMGQLVVPDPRVQRTVAWCIVNVLWDERGVRQDLVAPPMVCLLSSESEPLLEYTLKGIANLAEAAATAGVDSAEGGHPGESGGGGGGGGPNWWTAALLSVVPITMITDCVPLLVPLLSFDNPAIPLHAARALADLFRCGFQFAASLLANGGVSPLVSLLRLSDPTVQLQALTALHNLLAFDNDNVKKTVLCAPDCGMARVLCDTSADAAVASLASRVCDVLGLDSGAATLTPTVSGQANPPVLKQGWMSKRKPQHSKLSKKRRYFQLTKLEDGSYSLDYYEKEKSSKAKGKIGIPSVCTILPSREVEAKLTIELHTKEDVYLLECESQVEKDEWLAALRFVFLTAEHCTMRTTPEDSAPS